jgi:hypothetical protein
MRIRRLFMPLLAVIALLPGSGCGCNRCCSSNSNSYAPPSSCPRQPAPAPVNYSPAPGYLPGPTP